jgi:hypothetical protein
MNAASEVGLEPTPFYGVFGQRMKLVPKLPNEIECPGKNIFMTEGAVGCYLSHYTLWNVLSYLPEDEFLIFEDDAVFVDDFMKKYEDCYKKLPKNWDLVYVGWLPNGDDKSSVMVDEGISIRHPSATHAYLIKKSALSMALDSIQPCSSPIDLTIVRKLLPNLKFYVFDPSLVSQRSFLNTSDSAWSSLVYDWKNDIYGCKGKLVKEISMSDGWYNLEKNDTESWRWSKNKFTLKIPASIDSLSILCSSPVENAVILTVGETSTQSDLKVGDNIIKLETHGKNEVAGRIVTPFVPSEHEENSKDSRVLGIRFKKMMVTMGSIDVEVDVQELSSACPPPMTFKL